MAIFKCDKCGATKETRCKPKTCEVCGAGACMSKVESSPSDAGCGCGKNGKK